MSTAFKNSPVREIAKSTQNEKGAWHTHTPPAFACRAAREQKKKSGHEIVSLPPRPVPTATGIEDNFVTPKSIFSTYLKNLTAVVRQGDAREESFYSALERMLTDIACATGKMHVQVTAP